MTTSDSQGQPTARETFKDELKELREAAGLSLQQLSDRVHFDRSYLHKLETGERLGELETIKALDNFYGTRHLQKLWRLAKRESVRQKYAPFMEREEKAATRYEYAAATVPGLLQTEEYATEQLRTDSRKTEAQLERAVELRMSRQEFLRREQPPTYRVILDEAVLRRAMKDVEAWNGQLAHIIEAAELPNVTIQVLPFDAGIQHVLGGSLTILWEKNGSSVAYLESAAHGHLVTDSLEVEHFRLSYDQLRDVALSPQESLEFIRSLMK
jgi:transcriptional regulator with XRE-family HTH domain